MIRALVAVAVACLAFVIIGLPTGVVGMMDPRYCFEHEERPADTFFHEETLGFFPPGPVCRFTLADGTDVVAGPGWWPAVAATVALISAVVVVRIWPRNDDRRVAPRKPSPRSPK